MNKNVIYILTNPSFPQYVKIGFATNLNSRLKALNSSEALPYAFRAYAIYETNRKLTDMALHDLLDQLNPDLRTRDTFNGKKRVREFFEMSAEDAYALLEAIAKISGTEDKLHRVNPTGEQILEEEEAENVRENVRRQPLKFSYINVVPGDSLYFVEDMTKVATVVDERHVEYEGATTTLSALAAELTGITSYPLQGPLYFTLDGKENLHELRCRLEEAL